MLKMIAFGKTYRGADFAALSAEYDAAREAHFKKGGRPSDGKIFENGVQIARVSNNGRVWPMAEWEPEMKPLFDNRVA